MGNDQVARLLGQQQVLGGLRPALIFLQSSVDACFCSFILMAQDKIQSFRIAGTDSFGFYTFTTSRPRFVALININKETLDRVIKVGLRSSLTFT